MKLNWHINTYEGQAVSNIFELECIDYYLVYNYLGKFSDMPTCA